MDNFDLKKYLIENKATFVSKLLSEESVSENMGLVITYPEAIAIFKAMELGGVPVDDFETMNKLQIEKFIEDNVEIIYNTLGKMKNMVPKLGIDKNTFNVIFDTIEKLYKGEIAYIAVSKVLSEMNTVQDYEGFKSEVFDNMKDIATRVSLNPQLDKRHRANDFAYLKQWMEGSEFKEDMATAGMNNMNPLETAELVMKSLGYYDYE